MSDQDKAFHQSFKPSWAPDGTLVYASGNDTTNATDGVLINVNTPVVSDGKDVHFARFASASYEVCMTLLLIVRPVTDVSRWLLLP